MNGEKYRATLPRFRDATERFYAGDMSVKEYKGISGGYGSYAQRGGRKGMVRLRLSGGDIDMPKMGFICGCIRKYAPEMVHITTCQSVQLHGLTKDAVLEIVDAAIDHGILTYGGGGDYPRNVTATPLSGAIKGTFDVQPYAQIAGRYLLDIVEGKKLPRKLKVGFNNTAENITDATARDLGFVARDDGKFDVYSGGGLGAHPKLGLLVKEGLETKDVFRVLSAMVSMFMKYGNYDDRSKARVRYMRDTLGDEGYKKRFLEELGAAMKDPSIPDARAEPIVVDKRGDGKAPKSKRAKRQVQDGLYYVTYHPLGGDPAPEKFLEIYDAIKDMEDVRVRVGPNETMYVINLTAEEADRVADVTSDGARTAFEASVSCVGNTVCQIGTRDSHGMLLELIDMERRNGFADGVLPLIRISGCVSSCSAHQLGTVGLRGAPSVDGEPAFQVNVNGSHVLGKERLGDDIGRVKSSELPAFFEAVGKAVVASGKNFREWSNGDPGRIAEVGRKYLHPSQ